MFLVEIQLIKMLTSHVIKSMFDIAFTSMYAYIKGVIKIYS